MVMAGMANSLTVYVDGVAGDVLTNQNLTSGIGVETNLGDSVLIQLQRLLSCCTLEEVILQKSLGMSPMLLDLSSTTPGSGWSASSGSLAFSYDSDSDGTEKVLVRSLMVDQIAYPLPIGSFVYGGSDTDDSDASVQ